MPQITNATGPTDANGVVAATPWKPHDKQAELLKGYLVDDVKRGVALFGRQTGKTMSAVELAKLAAITHQGTYFMVFKTYNQAEQVVWKQYIHLIEPELIYKANADSLTIELNYLSGPVKIPGVGWVKVNHDPNQPRSRIRLLGSDQADTHRGNKANGIIFDEYQGQNPENFTSVYEPMFNTTNGWALFMGTPQGYNHFYDLVQKARTDKDWFYLEATWRDNPYVLPDAIARARKEAEKDGNLNSFLQEYELEFRKLDRAVYTEFDRNVHVIPTSDPLPDEGQHWATIDFGYVKDHPTAINFVKIDLDGNWWVYDEINVWETPLEDIIQMIKQRTSAVRLQGIIGDSARPDLIASMQKEGLPVIPAYKNPGSKQSGIMLMKQKLKPKLQLIGPPKPSLYVSANCKETILNFEQYKYKEPSMGRAQSEDPIKEFDDHLDGLRYLALHFKYGLTQNTGDWGTKKTSFNQYGLPL
jgi:hypothetical protein